MNQAEIEVLRTLDECYTRASEEGKSEVADELRNLITYYKNEKEFKEGFLSRVKHNLRRPNRHLDIQLESDDIPF